MRRLRVLGLLEEPLTVRARSVCGDPAHQSEPVRRAPEPPEWLTWRGTAVRPPELLERLVQPRAASVPLEPRQSAGPLEKQRPGRMGSAPRPGWRTRWPRVYLSRPFALRTPEP